MHIQIRTLKKHLPIEADGYICKTGMILDIVVKVSAECSNLEATCADLEQVANICEYINKALPLDGLHKEAVTAARACSAEGVMTGGISQRLFCVIAGG